MPRRSGLLRARPVALALGSVLLVAAATLGVSLAAGPPVVVRIGAAGDIACDPGSDQFGGQVPVVCQERATSELFVAQDLDAVLPLGDTQYDSGALADYRRSYAPTWGRFLSISHPVPGNHEYRTKNAAGYWDYFGAAAGESGKGWYSFDLGRWHLVALNGTCDQVDCGENSEQVAWLRRDLAEHDEACVLAYWHYPLWSGGESRSGEGSDVRVRPLFQALYDAGADVVLNGHNHAYERFGPRSPDGAADPARGVRQFVVGTGGRSHYPTSTRAGAEVVDDTSFGVLMMTLRPGGYDWRFVPAPGGSFTDSGSASCH
ncbi:MAG: metallophosphoesterase [Kineosporiaceae bacterium]